MNKKEWILSITFFVALGVFMLWAAPHIDEDYQLENGVVCEAKACLAATCGLTSCTDGKKYPFTTPYTPIKSKGFVSEGAYES